MACRLFDDLFRGNAFHSLHDLNNKFNLTLNFLDYESMKSSIPKNWVQIICSENRQQSDPPILDIILNTDKTCKFIYSHIVSCLKYKRVVHENKWEGSVIPPLTRDTWQQIYNLPRQVTIDTLLQSFQFKIIHRLLITNKTLVLYGIKSCNECSFCHTHAETIDHLLVDCRHTKSLWQSFADWLLPELDIFFLLTTEIILFGLIINHEKNEIINKLLLLTKRFIYVQRCYVKPLDILQLLSFLNQKMKIELSVFDKVLLDRHTKSWSSISHKFLNAF